MTAIKLAATIALALPAIAFAQDDARYALADVVRVEPVHEVVSTPVASRTCWQEPVYRTVYEEPAYAPAYAPGGYGPSYSFAVSSGHYGGHGYGRHGYGRHGHGHGYGGHGSYTSYGLGYSSGGGYGYPGGSGERVLGAIAGGLLGNQFGSGSGKAATTFFGAVLGDALVADAQARRYPAYAPAPTVAHTEVSYRERCREETRYEREDQVRWYDVTYRWDGRLYHTRTPFDPGDRLRVRIDVTPVPEQ